MNKFTEAQKKEFLNWVGGLCNGRSDQWKAELLQALLAEHEVGKHTEKTLIAIDRIVKKREEVLAPVDYVAVKGLTEIALDQISALRK